MSIKDLLLKRYATKKFDPDFKVSQEDLDYVLECARLSASSINVQPWVITVVTNPELRAKLREASYGQPQVTDGSALIILSVLKDPTVRIDRTAEIIAANSSQESADNFKKMANGWSRNGAEQALPWLQRQSYLALQAMILAAMDRGLDTCPMEGFDPVKYAEILGMTDAVPTALLPIGKALEPGHPKVRVPMEDIVRWVK